MTDRGRKSEAEPAGEDAVIGGTFVIGSSETLKVISDPFRRRILDLVREEPRTAKEMASALEVSQTRLYYHIKLLEARGLIRVAETRVVSGIIERRYRATAYRLSIDKALIGPTSEGSDALDAYVSVVLDGVRNEINRSVDAGLIDLERTKEDQLEPRRLVLGRKWLRLTPSQLADFNRRYAELIDAFDRDGTDGNDPDDPDRIAYEWLIAFYPTLTPDMESHSAPEQP